MDYYKIVDVVNGDIKTLFHSVNGSKTVPKNTWVKAEMRMVMDGSSGTQYMSGWHVLKSKEEAEQYLTKFTNLKHKQVVKCRVRGKVWDKKHSPSNVYLAEEIYFYG